MHGSILNEVCIWLVCPTFTRRVGLEIQVETSGNDGHTDLVPHLHPRRLLGVALAPIA